MLYTITACTTLLSALLGLCFSINAVLAEKGAARTNALYLFARSLALACTALIPLCVNAPELLIVVTAAMLIVQIVDGIIGIAIKSKIRTMGPFFMAGCHGVCLGVSLF